MPENTSGKSVIYKRIGAEILKFHAFIIVCALATSGIARAATEIPIFIDDGLSACVSEKVHSEGWLYAEDIVILECSARNISDINGLELLPNLTELDLSNNTIEDISPLLIVTDLLSLNMSGNTDIAYEELRPVFLNSPGLINLDLAGIAIGDSTLDFLMPDSQLKSLNLSNTGLMHSPSIPDSMEFLNLSDNFLDGLYLPSNVQLSGLDISGNPIDSIDSSLLQNLTGLTELGVSYIGGISVADINNLLLNNPDINKLAVAGLRMESLRELELSRASKLQTLNVNSTGIEDIDNIRDLPILNALYAENNRIESIDDLSLLSGMQELDLSRNRIVDAGPLQVMRDLNVLHLSNNTGIDVNELLPVLEHNLNLIELGLGGMGVERLDVLPIFRSEYKLKKLDLSNNRIEDIELLEALPQLIELDLSGNKLHSIYPVDRLVKLKVLNLSDNRIDDINPLRGILQLRELDVGSNNIVDVYPLENLNKLVALDLSGNVGIDYDVLEHILRSYFDLIDLDLAGVDIGDRSINFIMGGTKLQSLNLRNTGITSAPSLQQSIKSLDVSANQLREFILPSYVQLHSLNISDNPIENVSSSLLKNLTGITELGLSNLNGIDTADVNDVFANNPGIRKLGLSGLKMESLDELDLFIVENLQWLDVSGSGIVDIYGVEELENIQALYASNNRIEDINGLNGLSNLQELDLSNNRIVDVVPLLNMHDLSVLNLSGNIGIDVDMLLPLLNNNLNLVELGLGDMEIAELDQLPIFTPKSKLKALDLSNNNILNVEELASLFKLIKLDLSGNGLEEIHPIISLTNLQVLDLSDNEAFDINLIFALKELKELDLSNNHIDDVYSLFSTKNLISLSLSGNSGIDVGLLGPIFDNNPDLINLDLSDIPIADHYIDFFSRESKIQTLKLRNMGLKSTPFLPDAIKLLDLSNNQIKDFSLGEDVQLTSLDISGNSIENMDVSGLERLTGLTELNLNYIGGVSVSDIKQFLENNSGLTKLGVAGLKLDSLYELDLSSVPYLEWLDVSNTGLTDIHEVTRLENLKSFFAANNGIDSIDELIDFPRLEELDLRGNRISYMTPLSMMSDLTVLNLSENTDITIDMLTPILANNLKLVELGLGGMNIESLNDLPIFTDHSKLEVLDLSNNNIHDVELLSSLTKLVELDLSDNVLQQIYSLSQLPEIISLDLSDNKITNLSPLKSIMKIQYLDLSNNYVVFINDLYHLTEMTSLNLSGNRKIDFSDVSRVVGDNVNLVHLGLADISIGETPLDFIEADSKLQSLDLSNTGLLYMPVLPDGIKSLNVSGNELKDIFIRSGIYLNALDISDNPVEYIDSRLLRNSSGITKLNVSNIIGVNVEDINHMLGNNPGITKLGVAGLKMNSLDELYLDRIKKLQWLDVSDTGIEDIDGVEYLPELKALYAENNNIKSIDGLRSFSLMQELDLSGNEISDVTPLNSMEELFVLDLSGNVDIDAADVQHLLYHNDSLVELGLGGIKLLDLNQLPIFISGSNLKRLDLSNNNISNIELLRSLPKLVDLNLSGNDLEAIDSLFKLNFSANDSSVITSAEGPTYLKILNLSDNRIVNILPIAYLPGLTDLNLSNNKINVVAPLYNPSQLISLDLSGNSGIDYRELEPIFNNNPELVTLSLADIAIGDQSMDFLLPPSKIKSLNLRNTDLLVTPWVPDSLRVLNLSDNMLRQLDLPYEGELSALDVSGNFIDSIDSTFLRRLTGLTELNLSGVNGVSIADIKDVLRNNPAIIKLGVGGFQMSSLDEMDLFSVSNLQWLDVSDTGVSDIDTVLHFPNLKVIYAANNEIENINVLADLPMLQELDISSNVIADISPLDALYNLIFLDVRSNYDIPCSQLDAYEYRLIEEFLRSTECGGVRPKVKADFNGDGRSDILWRKLTSGDIKLVLNNELGEQASAINMQQSSSDWAAQQGDFNGDQRIDLLWRNSATGEASIELSAADGSADVGVVIEHRGTGWSANVGDFNGDGIDDILWRQPLSGKAEVQINGATAALVRTEILLDKYGAWTHQLGDFNGDNRTDILWRKMSSGDVKVALSDANGNQGTVTKHFNKWAAWESTIGDFNGDSRDDILWRKVSSGDVKIAISGADGSQESIAKHYAKYAAWTHSVGDFNGDGADDILWRKIANGLVKVAVSDTQGLQGYVTKHFNKYAAWQHFIGDYNGDDRDDILWRKPVSGEVKIAVSDINSAQASVAKHYSKGDAWSLVH